MAELQKEAKGFFLSNPGVEEAIKNNLKGGTGLTRPQFVADLSNTVNDRVDMINRLINLGRTTKPREAEEQLRNFFNGLDMPEEVKKVGNGVNGSIADEINWIAKYVALQAGDKGFTFDAKGFTRQMQQKIGQITFDPNAKSDPNLYLGSTGKNLPPTY